MKYNINKTPLFEAALKIVEKICNAGGSAYFVGGFVRNALLHKPCKDIDIVSTLMPDKLLEIFPDAQTAGASFGVLIIPSGKFHFEVASAREERFYMDGRHPQDVHYTTDIKTDSMRRDFTVNAMFFDPLKMEIIDFNNGISDLEKGILRTVGDGAQRFSEDYLRMLRAIRFAAKYDFNIEANTWNAIKQNAHLSCNIAPERIRQELNWMLEDKNAFKAVEMLDKSGILNIILPEVAQLHGIEQPVQFHPEGDVFEHTMKMLRSISMPSSTLAWSVLLHDTGKKTCFFRDEKGIHFFGHEVKGAAIAEKILSRLMFSNAEKNLIVNLVKDHMRFVQVKNMKTSTLRKFLSRPDMPLLLELNRLDSLCSTKCMDDWMTVLEKLALYRDEEILPPPLIKGRDLIKLGIKPGPDFKKILDFIYEKQLSDKKMDFKSACSLIKKHFKCILKDGSLYNDRKKKNSTEKNGKEK